MQPKSRIAEVNPDQTIRLGKRKRPQQHGIYYAEDRRIRSDPNRKSKYGERSKHRLLAQHSRGVPKVLYQNFQQTHSACIATLLFHLIEPSYQDASSPRCLVASQAFANTFCNGLFEVKPKLVVEFFFYLFATE